MDRLQIVKNHPPPSRGNYEKIRRATERTPMDLFNHFPAQHDTPIILIPAHHNNCPTRYHALQQGR